jgi:signal transduction histidine kinase
VRRALEDEFARRLGGLAAAGATQVSADDIADAVRYGEDGTGYIALQVILEQLRAIPGTYNASLLDSARRVVYDCRAEIEGQPSPLDSLIPASVDEAYRGSATVAPIYARDGGMVRAGLAPVTGHHGVAGVLAVEAIPGYVPALEQFGRTMLLTTALIALAIGAFVVVRIRLDRRAAALERQLTRAENLAAMGQLTATLAHEIKNPLAVIRGSAQRLGKLEPEARRRAEYVVEEADRLSHTVARYLQFARAAETPGGSGDAIEMLDATLDLLEGELRSRKVVLERETGGPTTAPVRLDNESLKQVFLNLMLNALDAMPEGGRLGVRAGQRRGRVEIAISDTGPGIPAETLRRLGNPFFTTKAKGSGLGLFLSRRLVQSAGGALEITSRQGEGTTCIVRLPPARPDRGGERA